MSVWVGSFLNEKTHFILSFCSLRFYSNLKSIVFGVECDWQSDVFDCVDRVLHAFETRIQHTIDQMRFCGEFWPKTVTLYRNG